uniref:Putative secreted metalloprotease n=1 Tax=Ixodes ricinus TaxID=34613 RepID=A0A147BWY8_IXORI
MNPVDMTINILMLSVTVSQFVLAPGFDLESRSEETKLNLAVQIVYDRKFENISKFRENGRYLDYFNTFLNIVELWFRDIKKPQIKLTLHAATEGPDDDMDHEPDEDEVSEETAADQTYEETVESRKDESDEEDEEEEEEQRESEEIDKSTTPYKPCRNGSVTMKKFRYHVSTQRNVYEGADVVFFVTGHCVLLEVGKNEEWKGLPPSASLCTNSSVGVVHDDGKTFNGTRSAALQLALMLGASKDNETDCKNQSGYLLSNMTGGSRSELSNCSKKAISEFSKKKKQ